MAEKVGEIYFVVEAHTQKVLDSLRPTNASIDGLTKKFGESEAAGKQAEFQMKKTAQAIKGMGSESNMASSAMGNLVKVAAGLMSLRTAGAIISMADAYQEYADRIQLATESQEEYDYVQKRLLTNANATERQIEEAQELYLGTADSLRELGYSTSDVIDIGDSLSHSFAANAASGQAAQSAINAFSKSMVRGKVDAMQWISITAAAPTVINDIAKSTGRTTAEVRRMGSEGQISAKELAEALRQSLKANKELDESMSMTVSGSMNKITNAIKTYIGELNRGSGATETIAEALTVLAENFDAVATAITIVGAAVLGKFIAGMAQSAIASIKAQIDAHRHAKAELDRALALERSTAAAAKAAAANVALGGSHAEATRRASEHAAATTAAAAAKNSFITVGSRLLGVLGGPVGIVAMLASAAAAFLTFGRNAKSAKFDVDGLAESVRDLTKAQIENRLSGIADQIEKDGRAAEKTAKQLEGAKKAVEAYRRRGSTKQLEAEEKRVLDLADSYDTQMKAIERLKNREKELTNEINERKTAQESGVDRRDPEADKRLKAMRDELELEKLIGEAKARRKAILDLGDNASDEQKEEAADLGAQLYRLEEARKKASAAAKESTKASKADADAKKHNARVISELEQELRFAALAGEELAKAKAEASLNEFADPKEVERVRELAVELYHMEQTAKRISEMGADPEKWILGDRSPLSGGLFDDQFARFDDEAKQEEERLWAQLDRLNEALQLEQISYEDHYRLIEQMTEEHNGRMSQIDEARTTMMLSTASSAFDSLAGVMKSAAGEQSGIYKAMFAASKAFALAESIVKIQQGIANAAALPFPANIPAMAQVASATAGIVSTIASTSYGGGRQYGGPVAAGKMYRINENGAPEVYNAANGQQFLLPNTRGEVVSNKEAVRSSAQSSPRITVNLIEDASRGGQVEQSIGAENEQVITAFVADIRGGGQASQALETTYGLRRQGR